MHEPPHLPALAQVIGQLAGASVALLALSDSGEVLEAAGGWPGAAFLDPGWRVPGEAWAELSAGRACEVELDGTAHALTPVSGEPGRARWVVVRLANRSLALPRFAQHLVHTLRNSLSSIKLGIQALGRSPALPGRERQRLEISAREVRRMERLLTTANEYARPSGRTWEPLDVRELLLAAVAEVGPEFEARGVKLELAPVPTLAPVHGNLVRLRTAMENLLLAAASATPSGGRVRAELSAAEGAPRLTLHDGGPPLREGEQRTLFEPLASGPRAAGLDLALAAQVAAELGGELQARNDPAGGVVLTLRLGHTRRAHGHAALGG